MSVVSLFTELCAAFRIADAQLRVAITTDETTRTHARLLRRQAVLLDRIESFVPGNVHELDEMIDFYARRRIDTLQTFRPDADRIADLLTRFDPTGLPRGRPVVGRLTPIPDRLPPSVESEDLARLVIRAPGRVAAIGPDRRYLAVSIGLAGNYRTTPSRMAGRHVAEVIGCNRYRGLKRRALEAAFQGNPRSYSYNTVGPDGHPVETQVHLRAIADGEGRRYAVLHTSEQSPRPA